MAHGSFYYTDVETERNSSPDRREAERFDLSLKASISTDRAGEGILVSPAEVRNMSRCGVLVSTRHKLNPFQDVTVSLPTDQCPEGMNLPEAFVGPATVVRAEDEEDRWLVALRFSNHFGHAPEFADYMDFLQILGQLGPVLSETD